MRAKTMRCEEVAELSAALALDSVEPAERAALEAHLERCPDCRREQDELRELAAQLALRLPRQEPPPALRQRLLAAAQAHPAETLGHRPPAHLTTWQRFQRWSPAVSLASLAAAVVALIWGLSLQTQLDTSRQQLALATLQLEGLRGSYGAVVQVLGSQQTAVKELEPGAGAPGARGKLWIDPGTGQGMMMARDLPPLPEGQGYQVWLVNEHGRISPGFLRAYDGGVYYLVLHTPEKLTSYQRVGVTREPLPGSPGPTTPRIVGANL